MTTNTYQNQKIQLRFSKKSIDKAARSIRYNCDGEKRIEAVEKIQNFRELHMYPLMLMKNHLARAAKSINKNIIVARRLKRLSTIIDKLERPTLDGHQENAIKLTRMQDIGGCRAIVGNLKELNSLHEKLKASKSKHKIIHTSNYLTPKKSGYGGIHLIYSCFDEDGAENSWRKTKIEVQLRTKLQHAWATSLEIIDTIEQIKLKTSLEGHSEWRELFSVVGQLVAFKDGAIELEDQLLKKHRVRLKELEEKLELRKKLLAFSLGIKATTSKEFRKINKRKVGMCLVTMEPQKFNPRKIGEGKYEVELNVSIETYKVSETKTALKALNKSELDETKVLSVLLSTSDAKSLKKAYPNYFGSTTAFSTFIEKQIEGI